MFIFYGSTLTFSPFIFDDYLHIFDNKTVLARSLKSFIFYLTKSLTPIPFLFWKVISFFNLDQNPLWYRLINFAFHALNTFIIYKITLDYFKEREKSRFLPWFTALVYCIHPTQVESVVWISSLRGLSATFFALLFIKEFLLQKRRCFAFFILGLLCKPTIVASFPFAIILFYAKNKRLPKSIGPLALAGLLLSLFFFFIHKSDILSTHFESIDFLLRLKLTLSSISLYLINLLLPFRLSFDYQMNAFTVSYLEEVGELLPLILISPLFIMGIISLFRRKKERDFSLELGLLGVGFLILLTPHMGLVLHDFNNLSVVSDRYLNLPLFGFSLFLGLLFQRFQKSFTRRFESFPPQIHFFFFLLLLGPLCFYQTQKWHQPIELLGQSNRFMAVREATLLGIANQFQNLGDLRNARKNLKNALAANPNSHEALLALIEMNEVSPHPQEENFIINHVQNPLFNKTTELYLPLAKLFFKKKLFSESQELISLAISNKIKLKEAYLLKEKLEEAQIKDVLNSLRTLEVHHEIKSDYSKALFYCQEFLKYKPFDEDALERQKIYKQKLRERL